MTLRLSLSNATIRELLDESLAELAAFGPLPNVPEEERERIDLAYCLVALATTSLDPDDEEGRTLASVRDIAAVLIAGGWYDGPGA